MAMKPSAATVEMFFRANELLSRPQDTPPQWPTAMFTMTQLKNWVRNARVFHIDPDLWVKLQDKGNAFATKLNEEVRRRLDAKIDDEVSASDFFCGSIEETVHYDPAILPFDFCFLSWGGPGEYTELAIQNRGFYEQFELLGGNGASDFTRIACLGIILTYHGFVIEFNHYELNNGTEGILPFCHHAPDVLWVFASEAFSVTGVVEAINAHKQIVTTDFTHRYHYKKWLKQSSARGFTMPVPRAYYEVILRDEVLNAFVAEHPKQTHNWSHRWDVRGHERILYHVRAKPLLPSVKAKWIANGWTVFDSAIPEETLDDLIKRRLRIDTNRHWMAMKKVWVDAHIKGPEDKPYVPAVRIVSS